MADKDGVDDEHHARHGSNLPPSAPPMQASCGLTRVRWQALATLAGDESMEFPVINGLDEADVKQKLDDASVSCSLHSS